MCQVLGNAEGSQMITLSASQRNIVDRLRAGASLSWVGGNVGKFQIVDGHITRPVNPRTIDALLKAKVIERDLLGDCQLATPG